MHGDAIGVRRGGLTHAFHYTNPQIDESYFGPTVNEYRPERWLEKKNERMDHAAFGIGEDHPRHLLAK